MSDSLKGSCACGLVKFVLVDAKRNIINCHCHTCRKLNGGAFSSYVAVADDNFQLHEGQDALTKYEATENVAKHFCRVCGTPIYNKNRKYPGLTIIPLGALDEVGQMRPTVNIFCDSKLPWVAMQEGTTDYPQGMSD